MKYINKRQNPITHISEELLDKLFCLLAEKYSEEWLFAKRGHPLQILWNRKDWISTTELFLLAASICNLERIDPSWTNDQIKNTKQGNENTRKGAFFELISLEGMFNSKLSVKPAIRNQAGYDGVLKFKNNGEIILSIKNYNLSYHHRSFLERCRIFENTFTNILKSKNVRNVLALIGIPKNYPSEADWKNLENCIDPVLSKYNGALLPIIANDSWTIFLKEMKDDEQSFDDKYNHSYTLIITSPYHKNEHKNIYSKLHLACHNLIKARIAENDKRLNCILIHVPITVSVKKCLQWTKDYFQDYPDDPISCVIYYQPAIVSDIEKNTSHIHHCVSFAARNRYFDFSKEYRAISLQFPVGTHGYEPTSLQFTNEKGEILNIDERYIFQSGNHFYKMKTDESGSFGGTMKNQGSGICNHLIWETDGGSIDFSGIIPDTHDLLII
jgi:hypothetical protein